MTADLSYLPIASLRALIANERGRLADREERLAEIREEFDIDAMGPAMQAVTQSKTKIAAWQAELKALFSS